MESLAYLHHAIAYEDPSPAPTLKPITLNLDIPSSAWLYMVGIAAVCIVTATPQRASAAPIYTVGSKGETVEAIQRFLGLPVDGVYGNQTANAVRRYQRQQGVEMVDGVVGPETLSLMGLSEMATAESADATTAASTTEDTAGTVATIRTVEGTGVNLRRSPNGDVIGSVTDGTVVTLTGQEVMQGEYTWVELVDRSWVAKDFISFSTTNAPTSPEASRASVATTSARQAVIDTPGGVGVNLRDRPNGSVVASLPEGASVSLTGEQVTAGDYVWAKTTDSFWVAASFLSSTTTPSSTESTPSASTTAPSTDTASPSSSSATSPSTNSSPASASTEPETPDTPESAATPQPEATPQPTSEAEDANDAAESSNSDSTSTPTTAPATPNPAVVADNSPSEVSPSPNATPDSGVWSNDPFIDSNTAQQSFQGPAGSLTVETSIEKRNEPNGTVVATVPPGEELTITDRRLMVGNLVWAQLSDGTWVDAKAIDPVALQFSLTSNSSPATPAATNSPSVQPPDPSPEASAAPSPNQTPSAQAPSPAPTVAASPTSLADANTFSGPSGVFYTTANAERHQEPGGGILGSIPAGEEVNITAERRMDGDRIWVKLSDGTWMDAQLLASEPIPEAAPTEASEPSPDVATTPSPVPSATEPTVAEAPSSPSPAATEANRYGIVQGPTGSFYAATDVDKFDAPNGSVVGTIPSGEFVEVTGDRTYAANRTWAELKDGTWVDTRQIKPSPTPK
jgi:hypothetical protein